MIPVLNVRSYGLKLVYQPQKPQPLRGSFMLLSSLNTCNLDLIIVINEPNPADPTLLEWMNLLVPGVWWIIRPAQEVSPASSHHPSPTETQRWGSLALIN